MYHTDMSPAGNALPMLPIAASPLACPPAAGRVHPFKSCPVLMVGVKAGGTTRASPPLSHRSCRCRPLDFNIWGAGGASETLAEKSESRESTASAPFLFKIGGVMPYKFKIGDRVGVVRGVGDSATDISDMVGLHGIITERDGDPDAQKYPWCARIENGSEYWFHARELEAAPAKKTRKKRGKR